MCEISPVAFHGDTIFCIDYHGEPYIPMKPIVENMGLDWGGQATKFRMNKERWSIEIISIVAQDGKEREMLCMPIRKYPAWLANLNPNKVKPELRAKIELYQAESDDALWNYWMNGRAERKSEFVGNYDQLTAEARAELKTLVDAKLSTYPPSIQGKARAEIWTRFNRHFKIAEYAQLPLAKLAEARDFLIELQVKALKEIPMAPRLLPPAMLGGDAELDGKYKNYLEEVEAWRKANLAEYERLYRAGMRLFEIERLGTTINEMGAAFISMWLKDTALSHISVFDRFLTSHRAPVVMAANLNARFESVVDVFRRRQAKR